MLKNTGTKGEAHVDEEVNVNAEVETPECTKHLGGDVQAHAKWN